MRWEWLQQTGSPDVIVVFGGWALGPSPFAALEGSQDVLFVEDWRDLDVDLPDLSAYQRRFLIAFSFGVAAAGHWLAAHALSFDRKVAVNGTLEPVSSDYGISPDMVEATAAGLNATSFAGFCRRAGVKSAPKIDVDARQEELRSVARRGATPKTQFDKVWLSRKDRIFPAASFEAAWADAPVSWLPDAPHAPFAAMPTWQDWLA